MNELPHRQTFIALRARRRGYHIASQIGYPHMQVPELHRDILPGEEFRFGLPVAGPAGETHDLFVPERQTQTAYPLIFRAIALVLLVMSISAAFVAALIFWLS